MNAEFLQAWAYDTWMVVTWYLGILFQIIVVALVLASLAGKLLRRRTTGRRPDDRGREPLMLDLTGATFRQ